MEPWEGQKRKISVDLFVLDFEYIYSFVEEGRQNFTFVWLITQLKLSLKKKKNK